MPYINIRLLEDRLSPEKKAEVIREVTEVIVRTLGKEPESTWIVIDEINSDNWGVAGASVTQRRKSKK